MINNFKTLSGYFKKLNEQYSNKSKKSLTDVLNSFRQITEGYIDMDSELENIQKYSNTDYLKCTKEEQLKFYNSQIQFINCLCCNNIFVKNGITWNWLDIFNLLMDKTYASTDKQSRRMMFTTEKTDRPIGDNSYMSWNGFQVIDLDIHDEKLANELKTLLFNDLSKYHWFLGICVSASHKSLHIWTKIRTISLTNNEMKTEYICNFRHKFSVVYVVLSLYCNKLGYTKERILEFMDMAMAKPQQGTFISSDPHPLMNTNFIDLRLDVNFEPAYDTGVESIEWINHPDLKTVFAKLEWFTNDTFNDESNIKNEVITNINDYDKSKSLGRKHYKHNQRWQLANTLTSLYGYEKALQLMCDICKETSYSELKGDVKTASIHNKPVSEWAIRELNKQHGFNIRINMSDENYTEEIKQMDDLIKKAGPAEDPLKILNDKTEHIELHIKHNQYLSDIKDDIIKNLSHITLLEAGAGYGKTEMIKALKAKTLLVLPYTSTIKAKVEASETTKDWLYFYGNKRPGLDDLLCGHNISMTIDKFSRLNVMELDEADFDYIVVDESHLLFTSMFRDVMSPTIQRLANCKAKIIMMTGTPTGELLFFPKIKHIKVIKEDYRQKQFDIHLCPTSMEQTIEMCKYMAKDIANGIKILYPTNKGNLYYSEIKGLIQQYLDQMKINKKLSAFYYKKSNTGDESMDEINFNKSIGDNDIIFCTSYLSVGIDICDRYKFSVYFNEPWMGQDIEQFANRLRNNDLFIKMFLPKRDNDGWLINYKYTKKLDLSIDNKDMLFMRDLVKTCNEQIERNKEESMSNPIIYSILGENKYLKFDENECKYHIDETTYKLKIYEERYKEYTKQLEIMKKCMVYYGYNIDTIDHTEEVPEDKRELVEEFFKACRNTRYDYIKNETFIFLDKITDDNIDIYKEILSGSYEIFKDEKYEEDRINNGLYVKDIEILERNIPIILGLYKFYTIDTIKDIFEYCVDKKQNRINYTKLKRIQKFVNIVSNIKKSRLDLPVLKFVIEARKWSIENPAVDAMEIKKWIAEFVTKYVNSIKDLVVDDIKYFETIYETYEDLWKVIIVQSRPKNGIVSIYPFELTEWKPKTNLINIYGGSINTQQFFLQDLIEDMKDDEEQEDDIPVDMELPEFEHTSKKKLEDVESELSTVVHKEFDYSIYSKEDGSNDRFMRKQENTNHLNDIKNTDNTEIVETKSENSNDLFKNCPF